MLFNILASKLNPYVDKFTGEHNVDFNVIDQLVIIYSAEEEGI